MKQNKPTPGQSPYVKTDFYDPADNPDIILVDQATFEKCQPVIVVQQYWAMAGGFAQIESQMWRVILRKPGIGIDYPIAPSNHVPSNGARTLQVADKFALKFQEYTGFKIIHTKIVRRTMEEEVPE